MERSMLTISIQPQSLQTPRKTFVCRRTARRMRHFQKKLPHTYEELQEAGDVDAPTDKPMLQTLVVTSTMFPKARDEEFDPEVTQNTLETQTPAATGSNASGRYIEWFGNQLQDQRNKYEAEYTEPIR